MITFVPVCAALCLALVSCGNKEKRQAKGFSLPEGDSEQGRTAFVQLDCHRCHTVRGATLPEPAAKSDVHFALGGEVRVVKSYGQLVTAIIQPQHVVTPKYLATLKKEEREGVASPMPNYNTVMTVQQMTDLVTFLHGHYKKAEPEYNDHPYIYYSP